jgi:putative NADPH-quinone reductase
MSARILVVYAHPHPHLSVANRQMVRAIKDLPNIELLDLYESSPDFHFDVAAEQRRLEQADLLVFQHPLHWFGIPALLQHWIESVLTTGPTHGPGHPSLRGKDLMLAVTTGADQQDTPSRGRHGHSLEAFLPQFQHLARYCGMNWQTPLILPAGHRTQPDLLAAHAQDYCQLLQSYPAWRQAPSQSTVGQD